MLSFVVPGHNEEALVAQTVSAVQRAAESEGMPFEVIVLDDGSTDATASLAAEQGARVVRVDNRQIAATRNGGAAASLGEWLVFVDADTVIDGTVVRPRS